MASLTDCLKKTKGLTKDDRLAVKQLASEYRKEGLSVKDAQAKAIDSMMEDLRGTYSELEDRIAKHKGYVDPVAVYEQKFAPAPKAAPVEGSVTGEIPGRVAPESVETIDPTADPRIAQGAEAETPPDPYLGINFRRGTQKRAENLFAEQGIDPAEVTWAIEPAEDGQVGITEVRKAIDKAKKEMESVSEDLDDTGRIDLQKAADDMNAAIERRAKIYEAAGDTSPEAEAQYLNDLREMMEAYKALERSVAGEDTLEMGLIKTIAPTLSKEERLILDKLRYAYKANGVTNDQAERMAVVKFLEMKNEAEFKKQVAAEDKKAGVTRQRSSTGRAMDELETGSTKAGIGDRGVQGILRSQETRVDPELEGQETVPGEKMATTSAIIDEVQGEPVKGLDTAVAIADSPREVRVSDFTSDGERTRTVWERTLTPVPFEATRAQKTADSQKLKKGDVGIYDPLTRKVYADMDNARMARGEKPLPKATGDSKAKVIAEGLDFDEKLAMVNKRLNELERSKGTSPRAQAAVRKADANVRPKPGMRTALMRVEPRGDGKHQMRVMSDKQMAEGAGIGGLLGREAPENWMVGQVPEGTKSGYRDPSTFEPQDVSKRPPTEKTTERVPNEDKMATRLDDLNNLELDPADEDLMLAIIDAEGYLAMRGQLVSRPMGNLTSRHVYDLTVALEMQKWDRKLSDHQARANYLSRLYNHLEEAAPNGIHKPVASKKAALEAVDEIFEGHPTSAVTGIRKLIERIMKDDMAPRIEYAKGQTSYAAMRRKTSEVNKIMLDPERHDVLTPEYALAHEIGHWVYFNLMTNTDKAELWRATEKFFTDATGGLPPTDKRLNLINVQEFTPNVTKSTGVRMNDLSSPQEYFANQFAMYVTQHPDFGLGDKALWKRIVSYVKALYTRIIDNKAIDPDLEPLFAKIIPNDAEAARFASKKVPAQNQLRSEVGKYILTHYKLIDDQRQRLFDAVLADDTEMIINEAGELIRLMYKTVPSKRKAAIEGREITGAFGPMSKMRRQIRGKANQLRNAMRGAKDDTVATLEPRTLQEQQQALSDWGFDDYEWVEAEGSDTLFSYENAEQIAESIKDVLVDTDRKYGSLNDVMEQMQQTLTFELRDAESMAGNDAAGVFDLPEVPESMRDRGKKLKPVNKRSQYFRKVAKAKRERKQEAIEAKARALGGRKGPKLPASGKELPSLKGKSIRQLAGLYDQHRDTKEGEAVLMEIARQSNTGTPAVKEPKIGKELRRFLHDAKSADLTERLHDSLDNGKKAETDAIVWEMQRRAHNRRVKKTDPDARINPLRLRDVDVSEMVNIEMFDNEGGDIDGIPKAARLTIRESLEYITHRDPKLQAQARTLAYRMFNLMGRAARGTAEEANLLSMQDVYRLSRSQNASPTATGVMADFTSDEFKMLRNDLRRWTVGLNKGDSNPFDLMHEIGHVLMRTDLISDNERATIIAAFADATDDIKSNVLRRKYDETMPTHMMLERQAEEWFVEHWAQYLGERVAKGDVFGSRMTNTPEGLELKGRLETILDRIIEGVAYMLNGLIGRKDIRQTFRRLTLYGDMFGGLGRDQSATTKRMWVGSEDAAGRSEAVWNSLTPAQRNKVDVFVAAGKVDPNGDPIPYYHASPNAKVLQDREVVFKPSTKGHFGPGIYISRNAKVTEKVFGEKPTTSAWESMIRAGRMADEDKEAAIDLASTLNEYRSATSKYRVQRADLRDQLDSDIEMASPDDRAMWAAEEERLTRVIEGLESMEEMMAEALLDMDIDFNPGVLPVYIRARNPFDATENSRYTAEDAITRGLMEWTAGRMTLQGASDGQIAQYTGRIEQLLGQNGFMNGQRLYQTTLRALRMAGLDNDAAGRALNRFLGEQGYDSIDTVHINTLDDAPTPHETTVLIETPDGGGGWTAPSYNIKHQEAQYFDFADDRLYYSEPLQQPINSALANGMARGQDYQSKLAYMMQNAEEKGADPRMTQTASKIAKGRVLSEDDVNKVHQASIAERTLYSNSARMRNSGMNWMADHFEHFFPKTYNRFAREYMPIRNALNRMPDADGVIRNWARKSNPFTVSKSQPASHNRIVQALRRGEDSRFFARLSDPEKKVFHQIREMFNNLHQEMVDMDVMIGNIRNYVPQVWDTDVIKQDMDGFLEGMRTYLHLENPGRPAHEVEETARRIMADIVDDDGLYVPPPVTHAIGPADTLDFQRLIRLDEHPGALQRLEPFLNNNLDFLLVKYLDNASKRIEQTKGLGVNVHAFADYMDVGQNGLSAITRLLAHPKVFTKKIKGRDDASGMIETATLENLIEMPFKNEMESAEAARVALDQYRRHGKSAAREYLMNLLPQERITQTYKRRVDAIANAMEDFKLNEEGLPKALHRDEFNHAEGVLRSVQGKQVNPRSSEMAISASRMARAFNNISLLSFTTLTSIPDTVLPLIRSGSFTDWAKGVARYASDADYRQEIKETGVAIENALHSRMIGMYGADVKGKFGIAQNAFFNGTMLTPWTDMWRGISGAVALNSFRTQLTKYSRGFKPEAGVDAQNRSVRFAQRYLNRYGLQDYMANPSKELDPRDPVVAEAMIRFANDTIFSPNPNDIPLAWHTPGGAILWQLKSFPLMMGRLIKDVVIDDLRRGDIKRPLYFAAFAPAAGMAAVGIKDIVQARGGEEGKTAEFRTRNFAKLMGYDESVHGNQQDFLGWYFEGLGAAGGFGLLAELLHDITSQADNSSYGIERTAGAILGPTFGTGASAMHVLGGVKEATLDVFDMGTSNTNSKERKAARAAVSRIPILGGVKAAREFATDIIAGDQTSDKKRGWGKGFGSGF